MDHWAQKVAAVVQKSNWQIVMSGVPSLFNVFSSNLNDGKEYAFQA